MFICNVMFLLLRYEKTLERNKKNIKLPEKKKKKKGKSFKKKVLKAGEVIVIFQHCQ